METLYLLCSIASSFVTSTLLSLALAVRSLPLFLSRALPAYFPEAAPNQGAQPAVQLYEGRVWHARRWPVAHSFEYAVRYALIDLDRDPQPPHLSAGRAREVAATDGPVLLLTIPASVGYEQNPLSVYYCYNAVREQEEGEGPAPRLKMCIAEVTNTPWGEKVFFTFDPCSDLVAKPLHVSPFMDMLGNWSICTGPPGEDLSLAISVQHPTLGNFFTATLSAKRVQTSFNPLYQAIYFWLMPHKVAVWIYWQALKLWWKGVTFMHHPRYTNPMYRKDALVRDQELCCSFMTRHHGENHKDQKSYRDKEDRWCTWNDAKWPWSCCCIKVCMDISSKSPGSCALGNHKSFGRQRSLVQLWSSLKATISVTSRFSRKHHNTEERRKKSKFK